MPTTWIVTRHAGAIDWLKTRGIEGQQRDHLDTSLVSQGDTVIGTLPVNLAAEVCAKQATYLHLSLTVPFAWRGKELTSEQMDRYGAALTAYRVQIMSNAIFSDQSDITS